MIQFLPLPTLRLDILDEIILDILSVNHPL